MKQLQLVIVMNGMETPIQRVALIHSKTLMRMVVLAQIHLI